MTDPVLEIRIKIGQLFLENRTFLGYWLLSYWNVQEIWPTKINFGQPNAENDRKITNGRLLLLALLIYHTSLTGTFVPMHIWLFGKLSKLWGNRVTSEILYYLDLQPVLYKRSSHLVARVKGTVFGCNKVWVQHSKTFMLVHKNAYNVQNFAPAEHSHSQWSNIENKLIYSNKTVNHSIKTISRTRLSPANLEHSKHLVGLTTGCISGVTSNQLYCPNCTYVTGYEKTRLPCTIINI